MAYKPGGTYAKFVLYVLLLVYISNQWCRYLFNYLYAVADFYDEGSGSHDIKWSSIARATMINNTQYALLSGFAFSMSYVVFGLVTGRAADRFNRRNLTVIGLLIWSSATILLGVSANFWYLLVSRVVLGVGEAFSAPASYSIIADYFPVEGRGEANGIYAIGVYVGTALGSLSIAMAHEVGWRMTCQITAAYGVMLAVMVMCSVREPTRAQARRRRHNGGSTTVIRGGMRSISFMESVCEVFKSRMVLLLFAAASVRMMGGYVFGSFVGRFYAISFPSDNVTYAYLNAIIVSLGGGLSSFLGGRLVDKWEKAGQPAARLYVPVLSTLLAIPFLALMTLSPSFYVSISGLAIEFFLAECWFAPAISVLQNSLPPKARGMGIAMFTFTTSICGSTAVHVVGMGMDRWTLDPISGPRNLRLLLLSTLSTLYALSALLFYSASRSIAAPPGEYMVEKMPLIPHAQNSIHPNANRRHMQKFYPGIHGNGVSNSSYQDSGDGSGNRVSGGGVGSQFDMD